MHNFSRFSDGMLSRYYAYLQMLIWSEQNECDQYAALSKAIQDDLASDKLDKQKTRQQRYRLNVLEDHRMVAKQRLHDTKALYTFVERELWKRGYPLDEVSKSWKEQGP